MNRSLLLVIADFLLLSLLALARFEEPEAEAETRQTAETSVDEAAQSPQADADLVAAMRAALEAEQQRQDALASELDKTQAELAEEQRQRESERQRAEQLARQREALTGETERLEREREQLRQQTQELAATKEQLEREREALSAEYREAKEAIIAAERDRAQLAETLGETKADSTASALQLQALQERLRQREAEAEAARRRAQELAEKAEAAESLNQRLQTELTVAESEAETVRSQLDEARTRIESTEREKAQLQAQTRTLAEGVGSLARTQDELSRKVDELKERTPSEVFNAFTRSRVRLNFEAEEKLLVGSRVREYAIPAALVSDGNRTVAICHLDDTPFTRTDLLDVRGTFSLGGRRYGFSRVDFLASDPRLVAVEVPQNLIDSAGVQPLSIAETATRFPAAIVVQPDASAYGSAPYKTLPNAPSYGDVEVGALDRLFGEGTPGAGDYLYSKSGRWLGLMTDRNTAILTPKLETAATLTLGDGFSRAAAERQARTLEEQIAALPFELR